MPAPLSQLTLDETLAPSVDERLEVSRIISRRRDGWAAVLATDADGHTVKVVGRGLGRFAAPGRRVRVRGHWIKHPEHGREIVVDRAEPDLRVERAVERAVEEPAADAEAEELLKRVPHLGAKRVQLLVGRYGAEHVIARVDANPRHAFAKVARMPFRHAGEASRWWNQQRGGGSRRAA